MTQHFSLIHFKYHPASTPDNGNPRRKRRAYPRLFALLAVLFGLVSPTIAQPAVPFEQSLDAYTMVDRWVRAWQVPTQEDALHDILEGVESGNQIQTIPVSVAVVTLRLDGRVFGRGSSVSLDPSALTVWQATKAAISSANSKLTGDRDAMWDSFIADLSSRLTVTLEIADTLVPMPKSELGLPGFGYTPGVLGVAVGRGDLLEVLGPGSMLARNTDMTQSAMALANALADDASAVLETPEQLAQSGYEFYRFKPIVLAQPGESMGASFIDRGGRVVDRSEISVRAISTMATNIAGHLMARRWVGVERYGMMGTLDPVTGRVASPFASPFEQALSAYALLRHGSAVRTKHHRDSIIAARKVLSDLAFVEGSEANPWDDKLGACMTVIALSELPLIELLGDDELNTLRLQCLETLDGLYSKTGGFDESISAGSHGLVAHALVRAAKLDPRNRKGLAQSAADWIVNEVPITGLVGQMPFLGWAIAELGVDQTPSASRDALLAMRALVWEHQLTRADLEWMDRDLEGGIVFTSSSTPLPSWISMKPLAFIATMLGDDRFTPGSLASADVRAQLDHQVSSARFIRQLCADGENLHMYASGSNALWGVRKALWDQRLSVEVDAMALLTLSETGRSFDAIMKKSRLESKD